MKVMLARDVTLTVIDAGAVLLDGRRGRYWQLNESGSAILRRLLDGEVLATVAAGLRDTASVSEQEVTDDVTAFVDALEASHLVEVSQ
jgi:hypothetical protein